MSNELLEALNILEQEKNISKETLLEAIENSLVTACKNHFGKSDNVKVEIDPETCAFSCYQEKTVVDTVEDPVEEISLADAHKVNGNYQLGDIVRVEVKSKEFGRIATQNAKNVILQKIREEERKVIFDEYNSKEKDVVTGVVQRYIGKNVSINLGKADALLTESEQIKGEVFKPTERIKVYILEVKSTSKGPKILVSRTHPELVKRLFESEVTEVKEGIVEIKAISREAGSRTKIAVWSNDPNVDPVGACVGMNGARVNAIVNELRGEKSISSHGMRIRQYLSRTHLALQRLSLLSQMQMRNQQRLLFRIISFRLQSVRKDRMQDLQQDLQASRLISRARHRPESQGTSWIMRMTMKRMIMMTIMIIRMMSLLRTRD